MGLEIENAPILNLDVKQFKDYHELVDNLEKALVDNFQLLELPLAHTFTEGLYTREMIAPKGTLITSKIHTTDHQFILSQGVILVFDEFSSEWKEIKAPHKGITRKGTRRIGYVIEDVVWTTMHATSLIEDRDYNEKEFIDLLVKIENEIIDNRPNNLLKT